MFSLPKENIVRLIYRDYLLILFRKRTPNYFEKPTTPINEEPVDVVCSYNCALKG
jgi:hypothetical protein